MRPLLQHASRSVLANVALAAPARPSTSNLPKFPNLTTSALSICVQCRCRASLVSPQERNPSWRSQPMKPMRRRFHQTPNDERKPPDEKKPSPETKPSPEVDTPPSTETTSAPETEAKQSSTLAEQSSIDNIARVPDEDLPSHKDAQRWNLSKRFNELMDELLPKLAVVTHKVNEYTGTDYSGIEALRREIKKQEQLMKARRAAIEEAKQALDTAHAQQASSQKEVVALLERKHSWSATDLERYMSLIRSEHVNDRAVREAKEAVSTAENALEEARAQLERRERAQYHEEQIWSDTIRRNSTWVTFGLMGLNIFLLLASLVIIEPWRRRRLVREIKTTLESQKASIESGAASQVVIPTLAIEAIEAEIDKVVDSVETVPSLQEVHAAAAEASAQPEEVNIEPAAPGAAPLTPEGISPQEQINIEEEVKNSTTVESIRDKVTFIAKDVVSERIISMRRIDYTTAVIQAAAAGAIITAAIIGLLRPR